jgi:hypothetical protein
VVVPPYCRSRAGRVFRIHRFSEQVGEDRIRYTLRATPIGDTESKEASHEVDVAQLTEKIRSRQVVPTPEETFEQLWQQLRLDVDAVDTSATDTPAR